jgi:UDP-N-acetylglucosamine:LPS N-acetylglucosamine transferase
MNKSILFLSIDGLTDALGQSQILPYLIGLSRKGYNISVLSEEKIEKLNLNKTYIDKIVNEENISWHYIPFQSGRNPIKKIFSIYKLYKKTKALCKTKKINCIHCRSFIPAAIANQLKKALDITYIYDIRGFFIEEKIDTGTLNLNNILHVALIKRLHKLESRIFLNASAIVTLTEKSISEIIKKSNNSVTNKNIYVIPTSVNYKEFDPRLFDIAKIKTELNIDANQKILVYLGSLGSTYLMNEMLDFFKCLEGKNYLFLILANDQMDKYLPLLAEKKIASNTIKIFNVKRNDVPKYLSIADIGISFIRPKYAKMASCPTKMGEMAAMGLPIVFNAAIGDLGKLNNAFQFGFELNSFESNEMKQAIEILKKIDKRKIRENTKNYFDIEYAIEKYSVIYSNILNI